MTENGYIPPQAIDMEEAVLGALLVEPDAINDVAELITPEMFYKVAHGVIYHSILELKRSNEQIDILTVTEHLRKINRLEEIGGPVFITQLSLSVSSYTHLESHALVILDKYQKRNAIGIANDIIKGGYDNTTDLADLHDLFKKGIESIEIIKKNEIRHISEVGREYANDLISRAKREKRNAIKTHLNSLNMAMPFNGLSGGDFILIAARPSMGKTAVALDLCKNIEEPSLIISLEMSELRLYNRLILGENVVDNFRLKNATLHDQEWENLHHVQCNLDAKPIYFEDKCFKLNDIILTIKKAIRKFGIRVVFIDYIGLIRHNSGRNREQDVSQISAALKECAKVEDVTIIALSQLNRAAENRRRPQLADLRDSGSLEQDADVVIFIYREDYQNEDHSGRKITELIIGKNRDGELKTIYTESNETRSSYLEIDKPIDIEGF